jgi:hypothetical protein
VKVVVLHVVCAVPDPGGLVQRTSPTSVRAGAARLCDDSDLLGSLEVDALVPTIDPPHRRRSCGSIPFGWLRLGAVGRTG